MILPSFMLLLLIMLIIEVSNSSEHEHEHEHEQEQEILLCAGGDDRLGAIHVAIAPLKFGFQFHLKM